MLAFADGVRLKKGVEVRLQQRQISPMKSQICLQSLEFSINNEMTTPKSCHDVTTLTETQLYISIAISSKSLFSLSTFPLNCLHLRIGTNPDLDVARFLIIPAPSELLLLSSDDTS